MKTKPKILVVDDQPLNVKMIERKLGREGMEILEAFSGQECLDIVEKTPPDLILLDVMMPGMSGIEVCEILKSSEDTRAIPILFITAKSSKEGKLEGLNAGAVDYITKPIDLDETLARVKTQLRIQEIYRENLELQIRLDDTRKTAAIGAVTQGLAHNLNNLLGVVVGYLDLVKTGYNNPDMVQRCTQLMDKAVKRIVNIVRQLSIIADNESFSTTKVLLLPLLQKSVERFKSEYKVETNVSISNSNSDIELQTNVEVFESILGKLLINGWESYTKETNGNRPLDIETEVMSINGNLRLLVKVNDCGSGIDPNIEDNMFEPFVSTKSSVGRGMGLSVARHSIRNFGGELILKNRPTGGTCALLTHPL